MAQFLLNVGKFLLRESLTPPSEPSFLTEDGFYFLMEDGSSKFLLE